jgi:hypothetical protein
MLLLAFGACNSPSPRPNSLTSATPVTSPSLVTASDLQRGHWSLLPAAPIQPRELASVVWTGREMLVWGGRTTSGETTFADGAAYDPVARRWRKLPVSPLSPRWGQATVWTGSQMIVWGGVDPSQLLAHRDGMADGAAYNPTSNSWQQLPTGPLSGRDTPLSVWTGSEVVVLGGISGSGEDYTDAAAFDPEAWTWRSLSVPQPPAGHPLRWRAAVFADGQLLAWSDWAMSPRAGSGENTEGADLFSFSPDQHTWRLVPSSPAALPDVEDAIVADSQVIVRGLPTAICNRCIGPFVTGATAVYNPVTMAWFRLPPDPLGVNYYGSAWTGAALFSFNAMAMVGISGPSGTGVSTLPGAASAYDPSTNRWVRLPTAPAGCGGSSESSLWTGLGVAVSCSELFTKSTFSSPAIAVPGFGLIFEVS